MKKEELIAKLNAKKEVLNRDNKKYDDRIRLPRTVLFSHLRNQVRNHRKIWAIDCAISLINGKHIRDIDCSQLVITTIPETLSLHDELLEKSYSIYLNERREVIRSVMEHALPICKKQVMEYI